MEFDCADVEAEALHADDVARATPQFHAAFHIPADEGNRLRRCTGQREMKFAWDTDRQRNLLTIERGQCHACGQLGQ